MNASEFQEKPPQSYPELAKTSVVLRVNNVTQEDSTDGQSVVFKWEYEVVSPATAKDKAGNEHDIADMKITPWVYLPKDGKAKTGKNAGKAHPKWTTLFTTARRLNISLEGVTTDNLPADFAAQFRGRVFEVKDFEGQLRTLKKDGNVVMQDDGVTPKQVVDYNWWQIGDAQPKFDVDVTH